MKLLIINPGGTSTKIAVFEDEEQVLKKNIIHTQEELSGFSHVFDQFGYRKGLILKTLEEEGVDIHELSGVAGRGGLMNPIPGGTYRVNERMLEDLEHAVHGEHPSNLGAALARSIGDQIGVPSFVVDPVSVDELMPKARISGISDLERPSWFHALNHKAVARWAAERIGKKYEDIRIDPLHAGGHCACPSMGTVEAVAFQACPQIGGTSHSNGEDDVITLLQFIQTLHDEAAYDSVAASRTEVHWLIHQNRDFSFFIGS